MTRSHPRRWRLRLSQLVVALLAVAASTTPSPTVSAQPAPPSGTYDVVDLGSLDGDGSFDPHAIDATGQVVGSARVGSARRAVLHDGTRLHDLGVPAGSASSVAVDINDGGQAVGSATSSNEVESRAVLFTDAGPIDLGHLGGGWATAHAINDAGVVVGSSTTPSGERRGFRWDDGEMVDLNDLLPVPSGAHIEDAIDIDERGHLVGRLRLASGELVGYHFDGATVRPIAAEPGAFTDLVAIEGATVVGSAGSDAATWTGGVLARLSPPAGDHCARPADIEPHGRIVGSADGCGRGPARAVLWQDGHATDLQSLVAPDGRWRLRYAMAINARGQIAAIALDPDGRSHGVLLTPRRSVATIAGAEPTATATSLAVAAAVPPAFGEPAAAVLVSGASPADVAVAATLAADRRAPLLLIGPRGLDDTIVTAVRRHVAGGGTVVIVGGGTAVSPLIEQHMASLGYATERHGGADRFETAVRVARARGSLAGAVLVSAEAIDAPSAIPVAVHDRRALLLTSGADVPAATAAYLSTQDGSPVVGIGRAAAAPGVTEPIAGPHRVATSVAVATRFFPSPVAIVVASAAHVVDGGIAGRLAASAGAPVVLGGPRLQPEVADLVATRPHLTGAIVVGNLSRGGVAAELDRLIG